MSEPSTPAPAPSAEARRVADDLRLIAARAYLRDEDASQRTDGEVYEWLDDTFTGRALDAALRAFDAAQRGRAAQEPPHAR